MKYTSAILLLLALIYVVTAIPPDGNPAKRSISTKRAACFYNNTFTGQCESLQTYLDRNSEAIPDIEYEFLDALYHSIYPQSVPHRDDRSLDIAHGVTYTNGLCPANSNYTMRIFVRRGHVFLGFWPEEPTCYGWVMDSRNIPSAKFTFPFFRECYHAVGQPGLGNITDYYTIGVINIEDIRNHLADLDDTNTFFSKQPYDALDNNCGRIITSAILATGNFLSFPIKSYVAERLLQEPLLVKMFNHPTNLMSLWPDLSPTERQNLSNNTKTDVVYKYQQNKNQLNHPSCDFSVLSTVSRSCVEEIHGPEFGGSNPEAWGFGIERNGTFCVFSWSDSELNTACGTITRTFKAVNLGDDEIIKTQTVVVDCPYCQITAPTGVEYECTEDYSVVRTGEEATGDEWCDGSLTHSDSTLTTVCGTFTRTWSGVDFCGRTTTETSTDEEQIIAVVDSTPPSLTCPTEPIACPVPTVTDNCGTTSLTIQNSLAVTRYAVTNLCGDEVIVDCENSCQPL